MRILHLIETLGPGGAERQLAQLARGLQQLGFDSAIATLWSDKRGNAVYDTGSSVVYDGVLENGRRRGMARLRALAKEADVIHTNLPWADVLGRVATIGLNIPLCSTLHCTWYAESNLRRLPIAIHWKARIFRVLDALTARLNDGFIAVSEPVRETYARALHLSRNEIVVIPNGVDTQAFDPQLAGSRDSTRAALGISQTAICLLSVGRLAPQKDLATAIRAAALVAEHHPVTLYIIGEGPEQSELERLTSRLGANVSLLGRRPDVPAWLRASDIFVHTPLYEGMPLALMEAMVMGCPIVCSDIPENRAVAGDCVEYAPAGGYLQLADKISALIVNPERRRQLSQLARAAGLQYDSHHNARAFADFISQQLIAEPRSASAGQMAAAVCESDVPPAN